MSILVVGVSHRSAPVSVLESLAVGPDEIAKLAARVVDCCFVNEVAVIATCNRVEVYAQVSRFHGSVEHITDALAETAGGSRDELAPHLFVHYDEGAIGHLFEVACGLDSMVVGEPQILGQVRDALRRGQDDDTVGSALNAVFQQALRVGKRAHAETGIDGAGHTLVTVALDLVEGGVAGRTLLVVGAGSMAALTATTAARLGAGRIVVANRSTSSATRLAASVGGTAVGLDRLAVEIAAADLVVSCTGSSSLVISADLVSDRVDRPLTIVDLALPHDVDRGIARMSGVRLVALSDLADAGGARADDEAVAAARELVAQELSTFLAAQRAAHVTPTVIALRSMAERVVDSELGRLSGRLPDLDEHARAEVRRTVRRVADKLLHGPTVRIKELAAEPATVSYADALAELFALDPAAVEAVTRSAAQAAESPEGGDRT